MEPITSEEVRVLLIACNHYEGWLATLPPVAFQRDEMIRVRSARKKMQDVWMRAREREGKTGAYHEPEEYKTNGT